MKILNFSLTVAAVLWAAIVLTNTLLGQNNAATAQRLDAAQALVRNAPAYQANLGNLVNRVNQAGATDSALKAILVKLQLTPSAAPAASN